MGLTWANIKLSENFIYFIILIQEMPTGMTDLAWMPAFTAWTALGRHAFPLETGRLST